MAAGRIKGITIEIGGDSTKLVSALAKVDNSLSKTQSNLRDLNKALKLDPGNTELLRDKQQELGKAIEDTKSKLETEKQALEQMKSAEGFDKNSQAARDLKVQIDLDTQALKELEEQAKQSASILGSQMQAAGDKIKAVGDKIKTVGDKIAGIGSTLTTKVTTPIVGAFGASAKAAVDWESAFTGVQKTVDATSEEYAQLAENIQQMATETASSANEIAGVMEIAGQLGISGVENLTNFTRTMVELGDTTNLSAEEAATALARFMNITGESTSNVDKIGSAIVDLGNNFATSESEITEMATRLASAGTIAGMSSTDILALSAAMSSVGIQAEAGGTAMTQTLTAMTAAVANFEAGSTDDLEAIANVANMSAQDFADAWNTQPVQAVQAFISGLGALDEKGENATLVLDELGMSGVRQSNMLKSLALASDVLTDAIDKSNEAYEENTALSDEAELRYGTMASQLSQLKASLTEVAVELGQILMPYIKDGVEFLKQLIEKFKALDDTQKENIVQIAAVVAAIGPALLIIGKVVAAVGSIISFIGTVVSGIGTLISVLTPVVAAIKGFAAAFVALTGPIGIAIAVIAAIVAAIVLLWNNCEWFRDGVKAIWENIKTAFQNAGQAITQALQNAGNNLKNIWNAIKTDTINTVNNIKTNLVNKFNEIKTNITNVLTNIKNKVQEIWTSIKTWLSNTVNNIYNNIKTTFDNIKNAIGEKISGAKDLIVNKLQEAADFVSSLPGKFLEWGRDMIDNLINGIKDKVGGIADAIGGIAGTISSYIHFSEPDVGPLKDFHTFMPDMINEMIKGINSGVPRLASAMNGLASSMVPSAQTAAGTTSNSIVLNVYGAQGQDVSDLADIIEERITENVMRRGAAFG